MEETQAMLRIYTKVRDLLETGDDQQKKLLGAFHNACLAYVTSIAVHEATNNSSTDPGMALSRLEQTCQDIRDIIPGLPNDPSLIGDLAGAVIEYNWQHR